MKAKIALIILDFTMPVMDGAEVFDELQLIDANVCVVLSSGFTEQGKVRNLLAKGLRGFIPKPYTPHKLLLQVNATLNALKGQKLFAYHPRLYATASSFIAKRAAMNPADKEKSVIAGNSSSPGRGAWQR